MLRLFELWIGGDEVEGVAPGLFEQAEIVQDVADASLLT